MTDYQKNITVNKSPDEVYTAIKEHIADWWSKDFSGSSSKAGDIYDIAFNETRKTFEIIEAIPVEKLVWKCVKAYIDMDALKNKGEWVNTTLIWTINSTGGETTLTFLHKGLNQSFECYDVCEQGWDYFLSSLESYLKIGKGKPFLKSEIQ